VEEISPRVSELEAAQPIPAEQPENPPVVEAPNDPNSPVARAAQNPAPENPQAGSDGVADSTTDQVNKVQ
jgi:hypothetical protein